MEQNYNFYEYGAKVAKDTRMNIEKLMSEIEQRYGKDAKEQFESGYNTSLKSMLESAKRGLEEQIALQKADRIDTQIANKEYEDDLVRRGMM